MMVPVILYPKSTAISSNNGIAEEIDADKWIFPTCSSTFFLSIFGLPRNDNISLEIMISTIYPQVVKSD